MTVRFALVALPLPLATPYTYRIPEALGDRVAPGARVVVPVRRRELIGVVVRLESESPSQDLKEILAVPDPEPALSPALLETAEWISGYYGAPLGLTLKSVLPAGMWGESQVIVSLRNGSHTFGGLAGEVVAWLEQRGGESPVQTAARAFHRPLWEVVERLSRVQAVTLRVQPPDTDAARLTERTLALAGERPTLIERDALFKRRPKQRQLYEALESLGGQASVRHLSEQMGFSDAVVRGLIKSGLARAGEAELVRDPFAGSPDRLPTTHTHAGPGSRAHPDRSFAGWSRSPALRSDRQRQDAGLSGGRASSARAGTRRDRAGSRDRLHPSDGESFPRSFWRQRSPCCTAACLTANEQTRGACCGEVNAEWRWEHARRCLRRSPIWA